MKNCLSAYLWWNLWLNYDSNWTQTEKQTRRGNQLVLLWTFLWFSFGKPRKGVLLPPAYAVCGKVMFQSCLLGGPPCEHCGPVQTCSLGNPTTRPQPSYLCGDPHCTAPPGPVQPCWHGIALPDLLSSGQLTFDLKALRGLLVSQKWLVLLTRIRPNVNALQFWATPKQKHWVQPSGLYSSRL